MRKLLIITLSLSLISCAGPSVRTPAVASAKASEKPLPPPSMLAVAVSEWSSKSCQVDYEKFKLLKVKDWVNAGNACAAANRWNEVESVGNYISQNAAKQPWGGYFLSLSAEAKNNNDRALWMIEMALKRSPTLGILRFQKGRLLWKEKQYTQSIDEVTAAVQSDGSLIDAHSFLGQVYFRDQDFKQASQYFYVVLKSRPHDAIALSGLAECRLQSNDFMGAMEIFKRAISYYPDRVEFRLREAHIQEKFMNDQAQALISYKEILSLHSKHKLKGELTFNLEEKIKTLERVARVPSSKEKEKGVTK